MTILSASILTFHKYKKHVNIYLSKTKKVYCQTSNQSKEIFFLKCIQISGFSYISRLAWECSGVSLDKL